MTNLKSHWILTGAVVFAIGCGSSNDQGSTAIAGSSSLGGSSAATGGTSAGGGSNVSGTTGGRVGVTTGGATGIGGGAAGGADCSPASGSTACGAPVACGAFVTSINAGSQPAAQAGTILDGTYELTQFLTFNGSGAGQPLRGTKIISQGTIASTVADQSGNAPTMSSGSYTISGSTLTWNITCPSANSSTYTYTASGNLLTLYQGVGASSLATIYTRTGP